MGPSTLRACVIVFLIQNMSRCLSLFRCISRCFFKRPFDVTSKKTRFHGPRTDCVGLLVPSQPMCDGWLAYTHTYKHTCTHEVCFCFCFTCVEYVCVLNVWCVMLCLMFDVCFFVLTEMFTACYYRFSLFEGWRYQVDLPTVDMSLQRLMKPCRERLARARSHVPSRFTHAFTNR